METFQFLIRQLRDRIYNTSFKWQFQCFLLSFQLMIIILLIKKKVVLIAGSVSRSINLHECNLKMQDAMRLYNG